MKSLQDEITLLALVLAVPVCVALTFPYEALRFRAAAPVKSADGSLAFVRLSAEGERLAMKSARSSLRESDGSVRWMRADLLSVPLLDEIRRPALTQGLPGSAADLPLVTCGRQPYLPSQKAGSPERIAVETNPNDGLAFTREALLKID